MPLPSYESPNDPELRGVWAAMANFINGDEKALLFLKRNKLDHYAELAARVQAKIRREGDEGTNFFNSGPFEV